MKALVALSALCALFAGSVQGALAEDDKAPSTPAVAAPSRGTVVAPSGGTGEAPPPLGSPNAPAAGSQPEEDPGDLTAPEDDATASDPDARDPYETEPSEDELGAGDDEVLTPAERSAGSAEKPDDPSLEDYDTEPDDAGED